jgi:hypothetical protein
MQTHLEPTRRRRHFGGVGRVGFVVVESLGNMVVVGVVVMAVCVKTH